LDLGFTADEEAEIEMQRALNAEQQITNYLQFFSISHNSGTQEWHELAQMKAACPSWFLATMDIDIPLLDYWVYNLICMLGWLDAQGRLSQVGGLPLLAQQIATLWDDSH